MAKGYYLFRGDKTTCGGIIIEGCSDHRHFNRDIARERDRVTCGVDKKIYYIAGGMGDRVHGRMIAGTLESFSTCPCRSRFIPSILTDSYDFSSGSALTDSDVSQLAAPYDLPGRIKNRPADSFSDICKPEDNPLLNGVYLWTETTEAGHAFISVHQNNSIYVYTYGRFGRTALAGLIGDGILNFLTGDDARLYYREELYKVQAKVFRIDDVLPQQTRNIFENLWHSGSKPVTTEDMKERTKNRGKVIDVYDLTGSNCTTLTVQALRDSGTKIFDTTYISTTTQLPVEGKEDFAIPLSLEHYLMKKSRNLSLMTVMNVTDEFKKQYPNSENFKPNIDRLAGQVKEGAAHSASTLGSFSGYSGGTIGGVLGGSYDLDE